MQQLDRLDKIETHTMQPTNCQDCHSSRQFRLLLVRTISEAGQMEVVEQTDSNTSFFISMVVEHLYRS